MWGRTSGREAQQQQQGQEQAGAPEKAVSRSTVVQAPVSGPSGAYCAESKVRPLPPHSSPIVPDFLSLTLPSSHLDLLAAPCMPAFLRTITILFLLPWMPSPVTSLPSPRTWILATPQDAALMALPPGSLPPLSDWHTCLLSLPHLLSVGRDPLWRKMSSLKKGSMSSTSSFSAKSPALFQIGVQPILITKLSHIQTYKLIPSRSRTHTEAGNARSPAHQPREMPPFRGQTSL